MNIAYSAEKIYVAPKPTKYKKAIILKFSETENFPF